MLTQGRLKEVICYSPDSGEFRWIAPTKGSRKDKVCGYLDGRGYRYIHIDGKMHLAARLAWLYMYGEWPSMYIDHKNCIKSDNRIENLRNVSFKANCQNIRKASRNNATGVLGVTKRKDKFHSAIRIDGKRKFLGSFDTAEEAHMVYVTAKRLNHEGCTL